MEDNRQMKLISIAICEFYGYIPLPFLFIFTKTYSMNKTILLGHGSGGLMTSDLIRNLFMRHFDNPLLESLTDSAIAQVGNSQIAFTTDSFVVDPIFFPGGDIGKLAVCGTVNDLAVSGAKPLFLSSGFIIEEGFPIADLEEIVKSMADEAGRAGVQIITGDTKVVKKGQCDKIFINTAGIGLIEKRYAGISKGTLIKPGDQIIVNGYLGDHEIAILSAREHLQFEEPVLSDVASLNHLITSLLEAGVEIRFMRDITRGGIATILAEISGSVHAGMLIDEQSIPVREQVTGICEIYGFNPLYLANEGKVLMIVAPESADLAINLMQRYSIGQEARIIGSVTASEPGKVLMKSMIGGTRLIDKLAGEQLPRIC
jgi:hydrogenase expression/formation protein HypE